MLPHECEIGLAATCSPGSAGVVGAAGAAASEYTRETRRGSRRSSLCNPRLQEESHGDMSSSGIDGAGGRGGGRGTGAENFDRNGVENGAGNGGGGVEGGLEWSVGEAILESGRRGMPDADKGGPASGACVPGFQEAAGKGGVGDGGGGGGRMGWFLLGAGVGALVASVAVVAWARGGGGLRGCRVSAIR